jgi:hypothetical protein
MSYWSYEKDASGRTIYTSSGVSASVTLAVIALGLLVAQYLFNPTGTVRFLLWSGFACILAAKLSLFRRGIWNSWGTSQMTVWWVWLYKLGYGLIGLAIILILIAYRVAG